MTPKQRRQQRKRIEELQEKAETIKRGLTLLTPGSLPHVVRSRQLAEVEAALQLLKRHPNASDES